MPRTQVLVVDDHYAVRKGLCHILSTIPELDIVCETASGEEAVEKAGEHLPDLILLDISLPGMSGIEAARHIRAVSPKSLILFMSQHDSIQMVKEALNAGGHGYVLKSDAGQDLIEAISIVQSGNQYLSKNLAFSQHA